MLHLLYGPAASGKTDLLMGRIRTAVAARTPGQVLLVPEQYSHEAERALCAACGDSLSLYAEVLSFTGLARRVAAETGAGDAPLLDQGGRLLCMALGALMAGAQALEEDGYFRANCRRIIETREYVSAELQKRGFTLTDSQANFLFAKSDRIDGETLYRRLREKGVLIRHFTKERIKDYNRITIGSREEMEIFLQKTDEILEELT